MLCFGVNLSGIDLRNGKKVDIKVEKSKTLVAFFLSSTCPCSQASFDYLNKIQQKYPGHQFIGLNSNKQTSKKLAMEYYQRFEIEFPIILDKELTYANKFQALKTPHVFVKVNGQIVFQGGATDRRDPSKASNFYLDNALTALKENTPIKIINAKTLGCYIRR